MTWGDTLMRRLITGVAALGAVLLMAIPAQASGAGAVSVTQTFHNATVSMSSPNPCTGAAGTITLTYNGVNHVTFLTSGVGAGTGWGTFTATGDFAFTPTDPSQPSFTGKFTAWDGFSFNLNNFAATSILVVHGTGSDGSSLTFHDVMHTTVLNPLSNSPTIVVNFDKPTCG
jgi:hypothetical protein